MISSDAGSAGWTARWWGALAGLVPVLAIALLFVVGDTAASPLQLAGSFALVTIGTTAAGWLAGPLAASEPRRLLVAAFGYAIALIGAAAVASVVQGIIDAISSGGPDAVTIIFTIMYRTIYLLGPALVLGAAWTVTVRGLIHVARTRTASRM